VSLRPGPGRIGTFKTRHCISFPALEWTEDVWAVIIAHMMSMEAWVKAAKTCKASWNAQLESVYMAEPHSRCAISCCALCYRSRASHIRSCCAMNLPVLFVCHSGPLVLLYDSDACCMSRRIQFLLKRCRQATYTYLWLEGSMGLADFMTASRLLGCMSIFPSVKFLSMGSSGH